MLIVAVPKSASTSLMVAMGKLHGFPAKQLFYRDFPIPSETKLLHRYHSDCREIDAALAETFSANDRMFKQHIPPTGDNLCTLRNIKKIILLRKPSDIVDAYYRAEVKRLHSPRPEIHGCDTVEEWQRTAAHNGLLADLEWFVGRWVEECNTFPDVNLRVEYADLVNDPKLVVNSIESHLGLPTSEQVCLPKRRYSRYSPLYASARALSLRILATIRRHI